MRAGESAFLFEKKIDFDFLLKIPVKCYQHCRNGILPEKKVSKVCQVFISSDKLQKLVRNEFWSGSGLDLVFKVEEA